MFKLSNRDNLIYLTLALLALLFLVAVAEQTAALNINTRYVYESILAYSEQLTSTLPEGLDVCFFVSSGS